MVRLIIFALIFMLMRVVVSMIVTTFFTPMMMHYSQCFEQPLYYEKEQYSEDEYEGDHLTISLLIFVCVGQYVDHSITDDRPTAQRIQQIDKVHEGFRTDERADAYQK